jgi:hypothetical protein
MFTANFIRKTITTVAHFIVSHWTITEIKHDHSKATGTIQGKNSANALGGIDGSINIRIQFSAQEEGEN